MLEGPKLKNGRLTERGGVRVVVARYFPSRCTHLRSPACGDCLVALRRRIVKCLAVSAADRAIVSCLHGKTLVMVL